MIVVFIFATMAGSILQTNAVPDSEVEFHPDWELR